MMIAGLLVALALAIAPPSAGFAESLLRDVPKLAFLKAHDPRAFDAIVAVYADAVAAGVSTDEAVGRARAAFAGVQKARLAAAPDGLVREALASMNAVLADLSVRDPARCAALLTGGNAGDIKPLLSPATIASEDAVYERSLSYAATSAPPPATAAAEAAFMTAAIAAEARAAQLAPTAFVAAMYATPTAYCSGTRAIYTRMAAAPDDAALFRRRLAGTRE